MPKYRPGGKNGLFFFKIKYSNTHGAEDRSVALADFSTFIKGRIANAVTEGAEKKFKKPKRGDFDSVARIHPRLSSLDGIM